MEYSIGFFGGAGMAYGTFTSEWPQLEVKNTRSKFLVPLIILILIIPFFVWDQSFETNRLVETIKTLDSAADAEGVTTIVQWTALLVTLLTASFWFYYFLFKQQESTLIISYDDVSRFFLGHLGLYTFYSILITCAFMSLYRMEQYLYIINVLIISILIGKYKPSFSNRGININQWAVNFIFILAIIALLTSVAVSSHGELKGAHSRF